MSYEKPLGHKDKKEVMNFSNPLGIILNFGMMGITSLFLALSAAYVFSSTNWTWSQFGFPKWFVVSALMLAASSFTLHRCLSAFRSGSKEELNRYILLSIVISSAFVVFQVVGWYELQSKGIYLGGRPDGSYLYLISGLHAAHVLVGMIWLFSFAMKSRKVLKNPVDSLMFFSDDRKENSLALLNRYWHFVDILWIYLLVFFLLNHL